MRFIGRLLKPRHQIISADPGIDFAMDLSLMAQKKRKAGDLHSPLAGVSAADGGGFAGEIVARLVN